MATTALSLPCLRTLATGDVRADDGHQLFVSYGCEGGPVIAEIFHRGGALVAPEPRADFQQRFFRAIDADVDGSSPHDVVALAGNEAWVFMRSGFSGQSGHRIDFPRGVADVRVADLDGNGAREYVIAGDGAIGALVDHAAFDRPWSPPPAETPLLTAHLVHGVAALELGGSPALDLFYVATRSDGSRELATAIQTGWNPATFAVTTVDGPMGTLHPLVVADVDGDGIDDVLGAGSRIFVRGSKHGAIAFLDEGTASLAVGDVDRDGQMEPVFITGTGDAVRRIRVDASGATLQLTSEPLAAVGGDRVVVADVDDDTYADLVLARDLELPTSTLAVARGPSF